MKRVDVKEKNIPKKKKRETSVFYRICYAIFSKIVGFLFRIRVVGEPEPEEGRFIVCANHIAASDPVVLCYAFRRHQVRFMAKKELFKIPLLAQLIRMLGAFPIDRGRNDVGAVKNAVKLVKDGKCMGIFPQGHRYPGQDPRQTPTKNGAALICTRAEADVVPVFLYRKDHIPKLFRRTYVIIGKRIPYGEFAYDPEQNGEYARITGMIFDRVCSLGEGFAPESKRSRKQ
ncbi:MAG: 1-acyl-sn-glycerol-3-phosphate acyltransferase [Clostridia bacterium]|nr:1-acyl-sn-glycerol-3-phosphate acyltransferase [Clostridia bacterium]